ncbi:MAG: hypothetical protein GY795_16920 [Desulfobacterales bacterium]|nr:hypothetical protein [Desulfobacterales bacterium]
MKTKSVCILAVFLTLASVSILYAEKAKQSKRITSYLPKQSDLKQGWIPVNPFRTASGNTLFSLINGGAELYIKNGFKWVVTRDYHNKNKKQIKLEIFKMANPAGAKTVYKHNATAEGKQIGIGDDSVMAGYYIFFRKDVTDRF